MKSGLPCVNTLENLIITFAFSELKPWSFSGLETIRSKGIVNSSEKLFFSDNRYSDPERAGRSRAWRIESGIVASFESCMPGNGGFKFTVLINIFLQENSRIVVNINRCRMRRIRKNWFMAY
jgi:hypothetical protein